MKLNLYAGRACECDIRINYRKFSNFIEDDPLSIIVCASVTRETKNRIMNKFFFIAILNVTTYWTPEAAKKFNTTCIITPATRVQAQREMTYPSHSTPNEKKGENESCITDITTWTNERKHI